MENPASWRALEHNGFQQVGVIRGFALVEGRWHDHFLYQCTAEGLETGGAPPAVAGRPLPVDGGQPPPTPDGGPSLA